MEEFNPNGIGIDNGNFFGLPYTIQDSEIVLLSLPWDATVSYRKGTSEGPQSIIEASLQVDLFDENVPEAWQVKIGTYPLDTDLVPLNNHARKNAEKIIATLEKGKVVEPHSEVLLKVNMASRSLNDYTESVSSNLLGVGKIVGVVGGEHSVPFGLIKALAKHHDRFGILHIDAHADLREAYEGFEFSHASIMYNALHRIPQVCNITQVGVRDFCSDEHVIMTGDERVKSFTDSYLKKNLFEGKKWKELCDEIIGSLPDEVYISFDIDGLTQEFCPGTGTPVPGGLSFSEADYLLFKLAQSGKKIIGFDLCEVSSVDGNEWNANVGARVLYKLALYTHLNKKCIFAGC